MGRILIASPLAVANITASLGTGVTNLLTPDPLEVFRDPGTGASFNIDVDLGSSQSVDTVFLGGLNAALAGATWTITGGLAGYTEFTLATSRALRVPERNGKVSAITHAFWNGAAVNARYVRITIARAAGTAMTVAALAIGKAFVPTFNNEWGAARGVKDTGTVTRLPDGAVSVVEGVRYGTYSWTLGDLTDDEADALYDLQLARGESKTVLVCENPDIVAGLRQRLHFGLLTTLRPYDRRGIAQTRWDMTVEDLIPLEK